MSGRGFGFISPRRTLSAWLVLAVIGLSPLTASASVFDFLRDRGEDFLDIFRLRYIVPFRAEGFGVKARATSLAQVGYIHLNGSAYGMDRRAMGHVYEKRTEGGISLAYFSRTEMKQGWSNDYFDPEDKWNRVALRGIVRDGARWDDGRYHPLSIGAEVELGLFGLDIGLYPTELIDFVTGWLFFDIYRDDRSYTDGLAEYIVQDEETSPTETAPVAAPTTEPEAVIGPAPEAELLPVVEEPVEPAAPEVVPSESTLGSELISPSDVEALRSTEEAPQVETYETPMEESKETEAEEAPQVEPAPEATPAPEPTPEQVEPEQQPMR